MATCINKPDGFSCQCPDGFHGDGRVCRRKRYGKLLYLILQWLISILVTKIIKFIFQVAYYDVFSKNCDVTKITNYDVIKERTMTSQKELSCQKSKNFDVTKMKNYDVTK